MSGDELLTLVILIGAAIGGLTRGFAGRTAFKAVIVMGMIAGGLFLLIASGSSGYDRLGYFILALGFLIGSLSALVGGGLVWLVQRQRQG